MKKSPNYHLFKLNGFTPARPGLLRVAKDGSAIALEVWQLPIESYGKFVATIPEPLCIGCITLIGGSKVQVFLCEYFAIENAQNISNFEGWSGFFK